MTENAPVGAVGAAVDAECGSGRASGAPTRARSQPGERRLVVILPQGVADVLEHDARRNEHTLDEWVRLVLVALAGAARHAWDHGDADHEPHRHDSATP